MATRNELEQRKNRLKTALREGCRSRAYAPGSTLPPVKEMASRYGISINVAHQALRQLAEEGILYSVPGVGTFAGRKQAETSEFYLCMLSGLRIGTEQAIQAGFEARIAHLGGASLALTLPDAQAVAEQGNLPTLAGVYGVTGNREADWWWEPVQSIPHVCFAGHEDNTHADIVSYDDLQGGEQAAAHLLQLGHRRIAFLGLHLPDNVSGPLRWSALREEGWRKALLAAGESTEGLSFHPVHQVTLEEIPETARGVARMLANRRDVTAVITANDRAALGLFAALRDAQVTRADWPAVVGFDNLPLSGGYLLTSLHLPADALGAMAAELLWERRHGGLKGPAVHRQVEMHLLPRLSSQQGWATRLADSALQEPQDSLA